MSQTGAHGHWELTGGLPASGHLFRTIAGQSAELLPESRQTEAWRKWLDALRSQGYTKKVPPNKVSWHQAKIDAEAHEFDEPPADCVSQRFTGVFRASADFCLVRSLVESSVPPGATRNDAGSVELRSRRRFSRPINGGPAEPTTEPFQSITLPTNLSRGSSSWRPIRRFRSEPGRKRVDAYTESWSCSEASISTATDPADLSKWKKGLLPNESIRKAHRRGSQKNERPTPPVRTTLKFGVSFPKS